MSDLFAEQIKRISAQFERKNKIIEKERAKIKELEQAQPKWISVDEIPEDIFVDVWISSASNKDWGLRVVDVCKTKQHSLGWAGLESRYLTEDIKPTYFMFQPQPPEVK
jgi:hypothetical protein